MRLRSIYVRIDQHLGGSMSVTKRGWCTPQPVVLERGTPEERVLEVCKTHGDPSGPAHLHDLCKQYNNQGNCAACSGVTGT